MKNPPFQLRPSAEHMIGDRRDDAGIVKFAGWDRLFFAETDPVLLEEPVKFEANFEVLPSLDVLICENRTWPVISRRMLDVLLSVGPFAHRAFRCVMIDDTVMSVDRYDDRGLRAAVIDERFVLLHLTTHVADAFDWERSRYERDDDDPTRVLAIQKLVLNDVPLPPVFRLAPYPRRLFVSAAAKTELESAGVRGVEFYPCDFGMGLGSRTTREAT